MKTLVFVACILAAVSADNILRHIKTSEMFDIIKLLDFQKTLEECALKLDSLDIVTPETLYCVAQKKNLINKDNGLKLHKGVNYSNTIVRNGNLRDKMTGMKDQCKEKIAGDKFKGSQYEKTMKFMECFLPIVNYILRKLGPFKNNI
ncbi:uncharacterized protein LOC105194107 [Solenopsis invicta]|uniref:uncharacterized protein LOC105194107 n=1 Tax=Solenopsis invicta TaxID=13686 RepID=UPI000595E751|nr:uncharacterized protein LOC105194107 [Solenopsis invicta]